MRSPKPPHARPRRTPAVQAARKGLSRDRPAASPARPPRRARRTKVAFLFLFVLCYFGAPRASRSSGLSRRWHPPFSPVAWCVRSSRGAFSELRWRAIAAIEATRPSTRQGAPARKACCVDARPARPRTAFERIRRSSLERGRRGVAPRRRGVKLSLWGESRGGLRRGGARPSRRSDGGPAAPPGLGRVLVQPRG